MEPVSAPLPNTSSAHVVESKPRVRNIFIWFIMGALFLAVMAITALVLLRHMPVTPLSQNDMTSTTTAITKITYPKQWMKLDTGVPGATYGNELGGGRSSAMINVIDDTMPWYMKNSLDSSVYVEAERKEALESIDRWVEIASTGCNDREIIHKRSDTDSTQSTTGLIYIELSCTSVGGKPFTQMVRRVLGNDGYARTINLTIQQYNLKVNRAIYESMIKDIQTVI